jgi:uncharacterized protein YggE
MMITNRLTIPTVTAVVAAAAAIVAVSRGPTSVSVHAPAAEAPPTQEAPGTFTVVGTATLDVEPDTAELHLTLSSRAMRPSKATDAVRAQQKKLLAALDSLGVGTADITLSHVDIVEIWDYRYAVNHLDGYEASISITADTKDFDLIGPMMDAAADAGATGVSSSYKADLPALKKKARDVALAAAKDKAVQTAAALGFSLGKVAAVAEDSSASSASGYYWSAPVANAEVRLESASTAATQGELQPLTVSITVTYRLP